MLVHQPKREKGLVTKRQLEIIVLLAKGLYYPEIGKRLGISEHTAEAHIAHLRGKHNLHNIPEIVRFAVANGLIAEETVSPNALLTWRDRKALLEELLEASRLLKPYGSRACKGRKPA